MSTLSLDAQATLLLTGHLERVRTESRPLTLAEWARFAAWMKEKGLRPGSLLTDEGREALQGWRDDKVARPRLDELLGRGAALALAVEKWQRAGLWIMTRSDPDYPRRLKDRLGTKSPTVLFGCGNRALLSAQAIAVVGSRKARPVDLAFAGKLGAEVAGAGFCLVSGGARGIDEAAMMGALDASGQVIGVLADSLLKAGVAQKWRAALRHGDLALVSPHHPEAAFNVGNAMARNKHVYCLAEAAVVVHSGPSGGTWNGATENLQHAWVPLWVRKIDDPETGNAGLVEKGGRWLPEVMSETVIRELPTGSVGPTGESTVEAPAIYPTAAVEEPPPTRVAEQSTVEKGPQVTAPAVPAPSQGVGPESIYRAFCDTLLQALANGPRKLNELEPLTGLTAGQLKVWLQRASEEGLISKAKKGGAYELPRPTAKADSAPQLDFFDAS